MKRYMRIGIDARLYAQTGVGRYIKNIISELSELDEENEYVIYVRSKESDIVQLPNNRWKKRIVDIPWHSIKEQFVFPFILLRDELDIVHFPYFNVPIFYPKKYLLTIHDLIVDHFDTGRASTFPYPIYKLKRIGYRVSISSGIAKAVGITTISQTTKKEIQEHYKVPNEKITVTYDSLDNSFNKILQIHKPKKYFTFPYILYVGNAYPHKNLERLLDAVCLVRKEKKIKLVLAGDDDYFYPKLKMYAKRLGIARDVIFFGNADDRELINLYSYTKCLVFPSLMEGFGLPNLEILACGKLPVVSDIPVFREIWGDRLSYFNPYKPENISHAIKKVLSLSSIEYHQQVLKARMRLKDFSWKKTAADTLKLYK